MSMSVTPVRVAARINTYHNSMTLYLVLYTQSCILNSCHTTWSANTFTLSSVTQKIMQGSTTTKNGPDLDKNDSTQKPVQRIVGGVCDNPFMCMASTM